MYIIFEFKKNIFSIGVLAIFAFKKRSASNRIILKLHLVKLNHVPNFMLKSHLFTINTKQTAVVIVAIKVKLLKVFLILIIKLLAIN